MCSINFIKLGADIKFGPSFSLFSANYSSNNKTPTVSTPLNLSVPWHVPQQVPSVLSLLSWNCAISNFRGREAEFEQLYDWTEESNPISVKFLTGSGGTGKSRLAAEFADSLQIHEDWDAGFVNFDQPTRYEVSNNLVLLVIDSPEFDKDNTLSLLKRLSKFNQFDMGEPWKIRVLLVTRQNQSDWQDIIVEAGIDNIMDSRKIELKGISAEAAYELYNSSSERASEIFKNVVPPISREAIGEWIKQSPENRLPIFIISAAINDAIGSDTLSVKYTSKEIVESIANYEIARLTSIAKGVGISDQYLLAKTVSIANIYGPVNSQDIGGIAMNVFSKDDIRILMDNSDLILGVTPTEETNSHRITPITPDVIAAAFNVSLFKKIPNDIAASIIWNALINNLPKSLVNISRMIHDAEIILNIKGLKIGDILSQYIGTDYSNSNILFDHLNAEKSIFLCKITITVCNNILDKTKVPLKKARVLILLSNAFSQIGEHKKAMLTTGDAIKIVEELYKEAPDEYDRLLANTLQNFAMDCLNNNLEDEATSYIARASEVFDHIVKYKSVSVAEYCIFLTNIGTYFLQTENFDKALSYHKRALNTMQPFMKKQPDIYRKELAHILLNTSVCYQKKIDFDSALNSAREALSYYEIEAITDPAQFNPYIARCYLNIATSYPNNVINENIYHSALRAMEIYESFSNVILDSFADDLAKSYNILSKYLSRIGEPHKAVVFAKKKKEIYSKLDVDAQKENGLNVNLFKSTVEIAHLYLGMSPEKADRYISEAEKMISNKIGEKNGITEPLYADLFLAISRKHYLDGDMDEAIHITQKAHTIFQKHSKHSPNKYVPETVRSLYVLGYLHLTKGEHNIARGYLTEGISLLAPYMSKEPDLHEGLMGNLVAVLEQTEIKN